jgi:hypothetical protein
MGNLDELLQQVGASHSQLGNNARFYVIEDLLSDPEVMMLVAAIKLGHIDVSRVTLSGTKFLHIAPNASGPPQAQSALI